MLKLLDGLHRKPRLRIAEVSKADAVGGGASTVAQYISESALSAGHPTMHYCLYSDSGFNYNRRPIGGHYNRQMMDHALYMKSVNGLSDIIPFESGFFDSELAKFQFDLFHFHDLTSSVSPLTLAHLARYRPVFWTLHDCSSFTGGCLYPMDCTRYFDGSNCSNCPQFGQWPLDTSVDTAWVGLQTRKILHASTHNLHLISPSQWLADLAEASGIVKGVKVIPNGVPDESFVGLDKGDIRKGLGIHENDLVIIFTSGHLHDERKNIADAILAINSVKDRPVTVITLGHMNDSVQAALQDVKLISPGFVRDKRVLAQYLTASDALIFTSLAENHPLSVLEAMAAGVCILGYDTGGVKEQVVQGETGLLVPSNDKDALTGLFANLPDLGILRQYGRAGRKRYEENFTIERMIKNYLDFFLENCKQSVMT